MTARTTIHHALMQLIRTHGFDRVAEQFDDIGRQLHPSDDGPDPDEQLEQKEAREHTERWVGGPNDYSDDSDALASAGFGTHEDYGG